MAKRRMKVPEPYRAAYAAARRLRWSVTRTGGNHLKWRPPGGRFVITGSTPGGGNHSVANDLGRLRESGLTW
jgi:hypothetical protein